jgi:hypothetical protein
MSVIDQCSQMRVTTYHHVEGIQRLEAGDHGGYERVASDFGEDIALVPDVLDLLETDYWEPGCQ